MPMVNIARMVPKKMVRKIYRELLVYVLKSGKPFILDANTGSVIIMTENPIKKKNLAEYTDIEGHYAERK